MCWSLIAKLKNRVSKKRPHQICIGHPSKKAADNHLSTTKYNALNFVPKLLFEKFTEPTNAFFLLITLIKLIPDVSPFAWHSSGVPLALIILFSAMTEGYEDLKRRFEDRRLNNLQVDHFEEKWKRTAWQELKEGHIVRICKGDRVPADLLVISSSEPGGEVYMETANLDGEANLKIRQSTAETMEIDSEERLQLLIDSLSTVTSDQPSRGIEQFEGVLKLELTLNSGEKGAPTVTSIPLNGSNLVVRGATVQNTEWMLGVVIFAGKRTKLGMNSTKKNTKTSQVHRLTNWMVLIQIGWLLTISAVIAFWAKMQSDDWLRFVFDGAYEKIEPHFVVLFLGEVILYSNLVPISLCVTIEFCLAWQAYYIQQDILLYDEERKQKIKVRSFGTIPNLGVIKYVMSDKTGTLTMNKMKFKFCSISGQKYGKQNKMGEYNPGSIMKDLRTNERKNSDAIDLFLTSCAVCHTVIAEKDKSKIISIPNSGETSLSRQEITTKKRDEHVYHACSPDEACLVRFACFSNYVFTSRTPNSINIEVNGISKSYEVMAIIEFTSTRKRMSILVRTPEGAVRLFVKGADTKILAMLGKKSDATVLSVTQNHLKEFANQGYRTLCLGYRDLSEEEYNLWSPLWKNANSALEDRQKQVEYVAEMIEKELILLGATAIEDKLQDRAPQTIARMLQADIHVWVLTGDKLETALNIGYSCSLLTPRKPIFILAANTEEETMDLLESYANAIGEQVTPNDSQLALIVDAHCLDWILASKIMKMDFLRLALHCSAVICCRCTPIQKASVTRLVRKNIDGLVLGIGDGANDVAMIQEADIGIGITGVEGSQASNAADFAISQFSHLDRLLFVHGTSCYYRITTLVLFSLYKNLVEVAINVAYSLFNGRSDQGIADEYTIVRYNLIYTCLAVLILGIHDSPAPYHVLAKFPRLYTHFQENMSNKNYMIWSANAIFHALLLFPAVLSWWRDGSVLFWHGRDGWGQMLGTYVYLCLVLIVNAKAVIGSLSITWLTISAFAATLFAVFVLLVSDSYLYPYVQMAVIAPNRAHYLGLLWSLPSASTFFFMPFICVVCLLPDVLFISIHRTLSPTLWLRVVQSLSKKDTVVDKIFLGPFVRMANIFAPREQLEGGTSGFMFAQDDGQAISQSDLLRMYGAPDCKSAKEYRIRRTSSVDETVVTKSKLQKEFIQATTASSSAASANRKNNTTDADRNNNEFELKVLNQKNEK